MKKILILTMLLGMSASVFAADIPMSVGNFVNDVSTMQNPYNQLQLLEEQRFRNEEYNEFNDMKAVKEARNKKINLENEYNQIQQQQRQQRSLFNGNDNVEIIRENGQLKIKRF